MSNWRSRNIELPANNSRSLREMSKSFHTPFEEILKWKLRFLISFPLLTKASNAEGNRYNRHGSRLMRVDCDLARSGDRSIIDTLCDEKNMMSLTHIAKCVIDLLFKVIIWVPISMNNEFISVVSTAKNDPTKHIVL